MILVDTNVISEFMRPEPNKNVYDYFFKWDSHQVFVSSVTVAEIYQGIETLPSGKKKNLFKSLADQNFDYFAGRVISFEETDACIYAQIMAGRIRIGRPVNKLDAMIASIAVSHNLDLVTRNVKDFEDISELQVINPWGDA